MSVVRLRAALPELLIEGGLARAVGRGGGLSPTAIRTAQASWRQAMARLYGQAVKLAGAARTYYDARAGGASRGAGSMSMGRSPSMMASAEAKFGTRNSGEIPRMPSMNLGGSRRQRSFRAAGEASVRQVSLRGLTGADGGSLLPGDALSSPKKGVSFLGPLDESGTFRDAGKIRPPPRSKSLASSGQLDGSSRGGKAGSAQTSFRRSFDGDKQKRTPSGLLTVVSGVADAARGQPDEPSSAADAAVPLMRSSASAQDNMAAAPADADAAETAARPAALQTGGSGLDAAATGDDSLRKRSGGPSKRGGFAQAAVKARVMASVAGKLAAAPGGAEDTPGTPSAFALQSSPSMAAQAQRRSLSGRGGSMLRPGGTMSSLRGGSFIIPAGEDADKTGDQVFVSSALAFAFAYVTRVAPISQIAKKQVQTALYLRRTFGLTETPTGIPFPELVGRFMVLLGPDNMRTEKRWWNRARLWRFVLLQARAAALVLRP